MGELEYRPNRTLYQYTSLDALKGIAQSKKIWLTDIREANDPRELAIGFDHVREITREMRHGRFSQHPDALLISIAYAHASSYLDETIFYAACLSEKRDSLALWGRYGSNHAGLSIGFRPSAFFNSPVRIQKVRYDGEDLKCEIKKRLESAYGTILSSKLDEETRKAALLNASIEALSITTATKHPSWSDEEEVRLMRAQHRPSDEAVTLGEPDSAIHASANSDGYWLTPSTRPIGNRIAKYIAVEFGKRNQDTLDPKRAIQEVIIGPKSDISPSDIEGVLRAAGFCDFRIERSDCAIR